MRHVTAHFWRACDTPLVLFNLLHVCQTQRKLSWCKNVHSRSHAAQGFRYNYEQAAEGIQRAALLSLEGDRCILPLFKLAVGNILRGKFVRSWRRDDSDGQMKEGRLVRSIGWGSKGWSIRVKNWKMPRLPLNVRLMVGYWKIPVLEWKAEIRDGNKASSTTFYYWANLHYSQQLWSLLH